MRKLATTQEAFDHANALSYAILLPGVVLGWVLWLARVGHPAGITMIVFSTTLALITAFVRAVAAGRSRFTSPIVATSAVALTLLCFGVLLAKRDVTVLWSVSACAFMLGVYAAAYWVEGYHGTLSQRLTSAPMSPTSSSRLALSLGTILGATFAAYYRASAADTVRDCLVATGLALMCWLVWLLVRRPMAIPNNPHVPLSEDGVSADELREPDIPLTEEPLEAEPEWWNTRLFEYTNDAIIIWEMQGRGILYWNRAAEQLYGYSRSVALGQTTHHLLKTQLAGGVTHLEGSLAKYGVWIGDLTHTTSSGHRVQVEGRLTLMSQRNERWLVLEVNRDITDRKALELSRRLMERQLEDLHVLRGG